MSNYIKIRELNGYGDNTGVFSGDMFAMALDTTTDGTPHSTEATQKATVAQVFESYNTAQARDVAAAQAAAGGAGAAAQQPVLTDSNGNIIDAGPPLTPATFGNYIEVGGGLEFNSDCQPLGPNFACTYTLGLATSAASSNFFITISGGSTDADFKIVQNPHLGAFVSGRFPTLKSAIAWQRNNISVAKEVTFLFCNDVTENNVVAAEYDIIGEDIEVVRLMDYGIFAMEMETNSSRPSNLNYKWAQGYGDYQTYNVVQYTGKNDGTIGDYNYYRCKSPVPGGSVDIPPPDSALYWERLTPSGSQTLGQLLAPVFRPVPGFAGDPNGFSSIGFTSRPTITFNPSTTVTSEGSIPMWLRHNGETFFNNIKMHWKDLNVYDYWHTLIRKDNESLLTLSNCEFYLEGTQIQSVFEIQDNSFFRITDSVGYTSVSAQDMYNITGSAGVHTTMAGLYLSTTGLLGRDDGLTPGVPSAPALPGSNGTGIGCIVQLRGGKGSLGTEYWPFRTRNATSEKSRFQFGSGEQHLSACMEGYRSPKMEGNVGMTMCPGTTFSPGGAQLTITGYASAANPQGLGNNGANFTFPGIAAIAARQFVSNNIADDWRSGDGSLHPVEFASNSDSTFMSGDSFISSKYSGFPNPTTSLPTYERYPD